MFIYAPSTFPFTTLHILTQNYSPKLKQIQLYFTEKVNINVSPPNLG